MGNRSSCMPRATKPLPAVTVVHPDGGLRHFHAAGWAAADLMIEFPGHVIARVAVAGGASQVKALQAEDPIRPGEVYLLLTRDRFGCKVSEAQLSVAAEAVKSRSWWQRRTGRRSGSDKRVFPEGRDEETGKTGTTGKRAGPRRQWRPMLDTIHEGHWQ